VTAATADVRSDFKILGLICGGHFLSHFYMLALPAMMIFWHKDLGIGYTLLGLALSLRYVSTGVAQVLSGFFVDRFGALIILLSGFLLMVTAMGLMAFATEFWMLLVLIVLAGMGDAVFHPADYAILNGSISDGRMGRAFSIHTFSGFLGFAAAPAFITYVATNWGWRTAILTSAAAGYAVWLFVIIYRHSLKDDLADALSNKKDGSQGDTMADHVKVLFSRPVLLLFAFFAMSSLASSGMQSFSIPALNALHGTSEVDAGFAVSAYLLVGSFAVLAGGWISDRIHQQDLFAALAYLAAIFAVLIIALMPLHYFFLVVVLGFAGFCHGVIRPARDMMVREAVPKGSTGKVFGFVFTGQNVGGGIAPVILGAAMDNLLPQWIFFITIGFMALCILTIISPRGPMKRPAAAE